MIAINWFSELNKLFKCKKNADDLISSDELFSFMAFINLPPIEAFVLATICSAPRRAKGLKTSDVISNCTQALPKDKVESAFEELVFSGWLFTSREDYSDSEEKVFIKPQLEFAFKYNDANALPKVRSNDNTLEIRFLALKASSFRRGFVSLNDWKGHCDQFFKKKRLNNKIQNLGIRGIYSEAKYFLTFIMALNIYENSHVNIDTVQRLFSKDQIDRFFWVQKFLADDGPLIQDNLILIHEQYGIDQFYSVGEEWMRLFIKDVRSKSGSTSTKLLSRIHCNSIQSKQLIYDQEANSVLVSIESLLEESLFDSYVSNMRSQGFLPGLTVLISGSPGTGKTEYCRQLALKTKRDILCFEATKARSKWYGETERNIKAVFDEYRFFSSKGSKTPILLFNEADSIFSSRNNMKSSVGQVENVVQTILLNELENFDGILLATTNRPESFDQAFSRRFHYTVKLSIPAKEVRVSLLRMNFDQLTEGQCNLLAESANFTGADLINIRRRLLIMELTSTRVELFSFLNSELESYKLKRIPIGFK
jgi:hypothetical protein